MMKTSVFWFAKCFMAGHLNLCKFMTAQTYSSKCNMALKVALLITAYENIPMNVNAIEDN